MSLLKQTKRTICHLAIMKKRKFSIAKSHKVFRQCDFSFRRNDKNKKPVKDLNLTGSIIIYYYYIPSSYASLKHLLLNTIKIPNPVEMATSATLKTALKNVKLLYLSLKGNQLGRSSNL